MIEIILLLASIGFCHIIVDSSIVEKFIKTPLKKKESNSVKLLLEMMNCYQCAGFWCGLLIGLIAININIYYPILFAFANSFLSSLSAAILLALWKED